MKPTTTLQTQANTGKHRQFHPFPIKNSWGFIGNGRNVSFCVAPPTALLTAPPTALPMPRQRRRRGRLPGPYTSAPLPTTTTPPNPLHSPAAVAGTSPQQQCQASHKATAPPVAPPLHQPRCPAVTEQPANRALSRPDTAGQTQPVSPSNRTRPATSTQSRHLVISSAGAQNPCGLCLLSPAARLRVGDGFQSPPMSRRQRGRQLPRAPR